MKQSNQGHPQGWVEFMDAVHVVARVETEYLRAKGQTDGMGDATPDQLVVNRVAVRNLFPDFTEADKVTIQLALDTRWTLLCCLEGQPRSSELEKCTVLAEQNFCAAKDLATQVRNRTTFSTYQAYFFDALLSDISWSE